MVSEWQVPCKGQMRHAGLHGTLGDPYCRVDVGVLMSHEWKREPVTTVATLTMPASQLISQTTTDERPPYVRTYDVRQIARAFNVPLELLTTEAN